ncbi:MAG: esterase/lipase family protein, partial [Thermodesulfobacteriota bacterium]
GVTLENFEAAWTLDAAQSFSLPRLQFGGGFDLEWNLAGLGDLDIDLPDFSILFKLCLGAWLVERGGSFGFGFAALFGLFPSPNFEWPELPDLNLPDPNLPDLELPDWNSGPFAFPFDWPRFEVPDWLLFFENPWPDILAHLKLLFSKPSWAFPALRFLGGSLFGRFPDFSLPDLGWDGEGGIAMPELSDLPFSVSGAGTYENPWSLRLNLEAVRPFELLVWLDPDGPPADGWANVLLSFLPEEWRDLEGLAANEAFGLAELVQLLEQMESFSTGIERVLSGAGGASLADHLTAFTARLRRSDGLVPYPAQLPAADPPNWEAPFALADLPRVDHFHQLSDETVLDTAAAQINTASGDEELPVLCLGAAWESTDAWSDLLARFPAAAHARFNLREAGTDPDQIGLNEIPLTNGRFFIGDISVFNTAAAIAAGERLLPVEGETPSANSQARQVMRMVSRIHAHTGQKVILVAHSHAGLAALAAVQRENAKAPADKKIARLVTIGTPLAGTPLVWAAEKIAITGDDLEDALPEGLNIKAALEEAMAFLDRLGPGDLPAVGDTVKDAFSGLKDVLNADLDLPGVVEKVFPTHAFDGLNNPAVDIPACAIGSRLPDFDLKAAVLGWLESFLETSAPGGADGKDEQAPTHIGFGLRCSSRYPQDELVFIQRIRLDVFRTAIAKDANAAAYPPLPRLSWNAELMRENGWLVGGLGENPRLRRAEIGLAVDFAHTIPTVLLRDAYLDGVALAEARLEEVLSEVPEQAYDPEATLQRLMNRAIEAAADPAAGSGMFRCACELLTHLQLVQKAGEGYCFSMEGWQSLLNDADTFLFSRLEALATDADTRSALFDDLNTCFGIDLSEFPANLFADFNVGDAGEHLALKHLLSGLDLLLDAASGHDPDPVAWLDLFTDPGAFLEDLLESLFLSQAKSSRLKLAVKNALELDEIARPFCRVDYSPAFSVNYAAEGIYEICWQPTAARIQGLTAEKK